MYSVQEVAKTAGVTSRTLRHYDRIGILPPSRIGANGYRYYDERALVRLQRVLLLRELGLGLEAIGRVLEAQDAQAERGEAAERAEARILGSHLELLRQERQRIEAQIGAVERTIETLACRDAHERKGDLISRNMFEGFDHTQYKEEVEERWGADAYARSDRWWRGLGAAGQAEWKAHLAQLNADWIAAAERGDDPEGAAAQDLAERHVEWLKGAGGTPASAPGGDLVGYVTGLAEMYVADERFAANYGGTEGAAFVRYALLAWAGAHTDG
ncbi:HTH-type transcriptional activator TipA [Leucobacter soli]|uniref:HTH-type transcriptional activator TipA n=1 Tax=Leucobacter soli TaxID=2812850 RepID=A0A916K1X7_9MICO|nr:HTH-type transcriptional activator TipA [Leucobacter soli]